MYCNLRFYSGLPFFFYYGPTVLLIGGGEVYWFLVDTEKQLIHVELSNSNKKVQALGLSLDTFVGMGTKTTQQFI